MNQNVETSKANWADPPKEIDLCLQEANKAFRSGRGTLLDGNERLMIQES